MSESIKKLYLEAVRLDPSAIITLFEIDVSKVSDVTSTAGSSTSFASSIFRFHNNFKIFQNSIFFGGREYFALPIQAEGFEVSTKGSTPTPKLSLTSSIEGLGSGSFSILKEAVRRYGDLAGARVTRIKTFIKYIDRRNFYDSDNPDTTVLLSPNFPAPEGFAPDANAFFPPDIYFIDRKSMETKGFLEFELGSLFDLQGIKLPGRIALQKNCTWRYRGEGCGYEQFSRSGGTVLKDEPASSFPSYAPPVADDKDKKITDYLNEQNVSLSSAVVYPWVSTLRYSIGDVVYTIVPDYSNKSIGTETKNVNYYFVSKTTSINREPGLAANDEYWIADQCSKSLAGCQLRWGAGSPLVTTTGSNPQNRHLPFGGFPGVARL